MKFIAWYRIMIEYSWTGISALGEKITGKIESPNKKSAIIAIKNRNITLLSIKKSNVLFSFKLKKSFSIKQRIDFTQQLQLLLQASIPLADALSLIATTSTDKSIQFLSAQLKEKIISGLDFASGLSLFPNYFDTTYRHLISAGEQSGQLEMVLTQLIENQENKAQIKNKIIKALFYPISVLCIAIIICIGLLIFVIPQFQSIYDNFGAQLPTLTQCLISISHYLSKNGIYYLTSIVILFFAIKKILKNNLFIKDNFQHLLFKLPIIHHFIVMQQVAVWSQLLSLMLTSNIALIDALQIANNAITQSIWSQQLKQVREAVIAGKSLHHALEQCQHFPERAKTMIAIGENADSLPFMMKKIAIIYQHTLNDMLDRLSKLLEPVIMITVATMVSGLIIAMYLPIFKMGNVV